MPYSRFLFLLTLGPLALAESAEAPKPKAEAGATVTVTAEASPVDLAKTPNPVKVLDAEAIQASGAKNLGELMARFFPGQTFSNGGPGTVTTMRIGGSRGEDVVVLLDGLRLSDASNLGAANASSLSLTGIERVEVVSGPCSTLYGANAMGGVIALYTAGAAKTGLGLDTLLSLGTHGQRKAQLAPSFGWTGGWVRTAVDASEENAPTETAKPYRHIGAFLGLGQQLGEGLLTLNYRTFSQGVPIPYVDTSFGTGPRPASAYSDERQATLRNEQISGSYRMTLGAAFALDFSLGQALQDREESRTATTSGYIYHSQLNQAGAGVHWKPFKDFSASLLLEASDEVGAMPSYPVGRDRGLAQHRSLTLESAWEPMTALRLVGSVRRQKDRQSFDSAQSVDLGERNESVGTYRLGATLTLPAGHRVYASGGTGFNLPFLSAVMYHAGNLLNPTSWSYNPGAYVPLQNEHSSFLQAGYGFQSGPWSYRLEASRTRFSNLVYFDLTSTYDYANGQNLRVQGIETALAYTQARWGLEGSVRNQETRDLNAPADQQLKTSAVVRRPFTSFGLSGFWTLAALRLEGHWSQVGHRYENFGGFPALLEANKTHFNDLGLKATWSFSKDLSLGLRGEHLLQPRITKADWLARTYELRNDASQIYGFPSPGPIWSLEVRYRY